MLSNEDILYRKIMTLKQIYIFIVMDFYIWSCYDVKKYIYNVSAT